MTILHQQYKCCIVLPLFFPSLHSEIWACVKISHSHICCALFDLITTQKPLKNSLSNSIQHKNIIISRLYMLISYAYAWQSKPQQKSVWHNFKILCNPSPKCFFDLCQIQTQVKISPKALPMMCQIFDLCQTFWHTQVDAS